MRRILFRLTVLFGILILLPSVSASCISYGFFSDDSINHRSFLMTDGYHFGNQLFVESNCETQIIINGEVQFITNSTATLFVPNGIHNIELKSEIIPRFLFKEVLFWIMQFNQIIRFIRRIKYRFRLKIWIRVKCL